MGNDHLITRLMIKSHQEIDQRLALLEKIIGRDPGLADKSFLELKNLIEKHFLIEEKAIFAFIKKLNQYDGIPNLVNQHNLMLEILNNLENKIFSNQKLGISKLKAIIKPHRKIEEVILYPRLDTELDESQKKFIVEKIKKMIK